jgi:hypothetical protein
MINDAVRNGKYLQKKANNSLRDGNLRNSDKHTAHNIGTKRFRNYKKTHDMLTEVLVIKSVFAQIFCFHVAFSSSVKCPLKIAKIMAI